MQDMHVAICCLARDCRDGLERNLPIISRLQSYTQHTYVFIIENDSLDGTKEYLAEYQKSSPRVFVDSFNSGSKTLLKSTDSGVNPSYSKYRIEKMASYRNRYLDLMEEKVGLDNLDWVIMLDPDVRKINFEGIRHSFGLSKYWDVVHANGRLKTGLFGNYYYDTYAFSEYCDSDICTEEMMVANQYRLKGLTSEMPLIPVQSGFNALAIYRAKALKGVRYTCDDNQQGDPRVEVDCEHVALHRAVRNRGFGRQFLNPEMTLYYNTRVEGMVAGLKSMVRFVLGRG